MTISGIIGCIIFGLVICVGGIAAYSAFDVPKGLVIAAVIVLIVLLVVGAYLYFNHTASGIRALTDERAELQNGLNRTITIYTADGTVLKQYKGKIDIEQDQGYVKFDWNGKRYIYYNCYVETIADLR